MEAPAERTRGVVYTFCSFKGGVGRSMALANVAALLANWGKRVLVLDWDLEAPGIEKFFQRWAGGSRRNTPGLVDIIISFSEGTPRDWHECLLKTRPSSSARDIHIITAGQDNPSEAATNYGRNLQRIKWDLLFDEKGFGSFLERLRRQWTAEYDFVLVDSRTGITDIGGICTIHLPDVLVCLFTTTEQSLDGVRDVMARAQEAHASLPVDRKRLMIVPLPARDESRTEYKLAREWRGRFASELAPFYKTWVPKDEKAEDVLDLLKIPYVAFWSFGEKLPVLEEDVNNPDKLAYYYQLLARLMVGRLDLQELKDGKTTTVLAAEQQVEAAKQTAAAAVARLKAQEDAAQERIRREAARAERKSSYEAYLELRLRPLMRRYLLGAIACVPGALLLPGLLLGALDTFFNPPSETPTMLAVALFLFGLVLFVGPIIVGRRLRFKRDDLTAERKLFEAQSDLYNAPDMEALPLFFERAEAIIAGSILPRFWRRRFEVAKTPKPSEPESMALQRDITVSRPIQLRKPAPVAPAPPPSRSSQFDVNKRYDLYVSARRDAFIETWLKEFLPLFTSWASDLVGRELAVFVSSDVADEYPAVMRAALERSTVLLAIVTPTHFQAPINREEWNMFLEARPNAIVPVVLRGALDALPPDVRRMQPFDFRDYAIVGEGFQKTQTYVEFQGAIRQMAERVADLIANSPADPVAK
jgi:Mrp family chromosome partitioning ATPase